MLSGEMDTIDVIEVQLENNNTVVLTESDRNIANFLPALLSVPVLLRDEESQQFWSSAEDNVHVLLSICRIFEKKTRQILQELQAKKATTSDKNAVLHLLCQCGGLRLKLNASSENKPIDGGNVTCIKTEQSWNQVDPDPTPMEEPPPDDKHWIASDASGIIHEAAEKTTEPEECNQESLISVNVQDDGIVNFTRLENSNEVPSTSTGQTYILKKTKPFETVKFPFKRKWLQYLRSALNGSEDNDEESSGSEYLPSSESESEDYDSDDDNESADDDHCDDHLEELNSTKSDNNCSQSKDGQEAGPVGATGQSEALNTNEGPNNKNCSQPTDGQEAEPVGATGQSKSKTGITQKYVSRNAQGKRIHAKVNYCYYCETKQTHIARHLQIKHSEEKEVAEALAYPAKSSERKKSWCLLVNKGNKVHNMEVLTQQSGTIVTRRRPTKKLSDKRCFLFCVHCEGMFLNDTLHRHQRTCRFNKSGVSKGRKAQSSAWQLMPMPKDVSQDFWKVLSEMKKDEVRSVVMEDPLIRQLGEKLFKKHGILEDKSGKVIYDTTKNEYIRQRLRECGRLVIAGRSLGLKQMEDFISPENFPAVIKTVKVLGGFNGVSYDVPSVVLKIGHNLSAVSDISLTNAIIGNCNEKIKQTEHFQRIYNSEWNNEVSAAALTTLKEARCIKDAVFRSSEDVQKLTEYLSEEMTYYKDKLAEAHVDDNTSSIKELWGKLCQVTLTSVIIFNRRRSGEVSKLLLDTFRNRDNSPPNADVLASLSSTEVELLKYFTVIETRGKQGSKVPILLSPKLCDVMELLLKKRESAGIEENPYFFANPNGARRSYYRGTDTLRACAVQANVSNPESLQSTCIRKLVATTCQILNLKDNELANLAQYIGHDIQVHSNFYQQQKSAVQATQISKVLLAIEAGTISKYRGKSLEEIDINLEDIIGIVSEEEDSCSDSDDSIRDGNPSSVSNKESSPAGVSNKEDRPCSETRKPARVGKRKIPWTQDEEDAIDRHFRSHIKKNITVTKYEAEKCLGKEKALCNRNWKLLKWHVKNRAISYARKANKQ
ncbi:uncharacterized protein [Ptychodera flava]|uniref:uncharacterized protein isoform X2 n=1 Tax=Ptychodera flava TaxID=63121 RepID=UPI00396AAA8C